MYALFRATVRVVDHAKKAALAHALIQGVTATAPGETLDEKLATLTMTATGDSDCAWLSSISSNTLTSATAMLLPPPSSETEAWWESPSHPNGVAPIATDSDSEQDDDDGKNPWDSDGTGMLSASPSSSDEELFNTALKIHAPLVPTKKAPPPPPPSRKPNVN